MNNRIVMSMQTSEFHENCDLKFVGRGINAAVCTA
jgi:hypothetical protein